MIDWENISLEDLAGFVSEELRKRGIQIILVGGACVTIYSQNRYQSYDLDFATYEDLKKVKKALQEVGFKEKAGYFVHDNCQWFIEFVSPPVAVGNEFIKDFSKKKSSLGTICLLRPEDSVKDRLASYFHWNDRQALEQAKYICEECDIDQKEIEEWAIREGCHEKYKIFLKQLKNF